LAGWIDDFLGWVDEYGGGKSRFPVANDRREMQSHALSEAADKLCSRKKHSLGG
jgi:hypothetical protein